jgi:uncharacterized protein
VTFPPEVYAFLVVVVCAAAFLNGAAGFGFAIGAVAGFSLVLDPKLGIILLSVITPVLSSLQLRRHWQFRAVTSRMRALLVAGLIGSVVGTQLLIILPSWVLAVLLGLFALWYVTSSLKRGPMRLAPRHERYAAPIVGFVGGVVNGTVGASGPVLGSYMLAVGMKGREWVFAISLSFFTMSCIRVATLGIAGQYQVEIVVLGLALAVPAYFLQAAGFAVQARFSIEAFQRIVLIVLLAASVNLLWRGISQALASL